MQAKNSPVRRRVWRWLSGQESQVDMFPISPTCISVLQTMSDFRVDRFVLIKINSPALKSRGVGHDRLRERNQIPVNEYSAK